MGLFYVWLKFCGPPTNIYQRLFTFVDREAADAWWRTISTPPSVHAGHVKRLSPQFYVQVSGEDVWLSFCTGTLPGTRHLFERMFSGCALSGATVITTAIIPLSDLADHISGQWCFIRSKADPFSHWYLRTSETCAVCGDANCDAVHVSSSYRTRFCIRVRNNPQIPEDFVMIGGDEVAIVAPKGYIVHINDAGDLKATKGYQGQIDMLFGDLKDRFITRVERQTNGEVWEYVESLEKGEGEVWELVK